MTAMNITGINEKKKSVLKTYWHNHAMSILVNLFGLLPFIIGVVVSALYWNVPLSEQQYKEMEKIAYSVYDQKLNNVQLYEVPEDYNVTFTDTTIIISHNESVGVIEARIENGKLITTRDEEMAKRISINLAIGLIFEAVIVLVIFFTEFFC